jgi:hypothetical protein
MLLCLHTMAAVPACSVPGGEALGDARERFLPAYTIGNVVIDPATYHFVIPAELLTSTEGAGPRQLSLVVGTAVTPHISFTGTHTPAKLDLSEALGYDVSKEVTLSGATTVLVPVDAYARIDAYTTYQRATWTMFGLGGVALGLGATYRPIGVYFSTCGCIGLDPCSSCAAGFPSGGAPAAQGSSSPSSPAQNNWGVVPGSGDADAGADGG